MKKLMSVIGLVVGIAVSVTLMFAHNTLWGLAALACAGGLAAMAYADHQRSYLPPVNKPFAPIVPVYLDQDPAALAEEDERLRKFLERGAW